MLYISFNLTKKETFGTIKPHMGVVCMKSRIKNLTIGSVLTISGIVSMGGSFILMKESGLYQAIAIPVVLLSTGKYHLDKVLEEKKCL